MPESRFRRLPFSDIRPDGVVGSLLAKQAAGLTGHMPELFPDVGAASAWLGGAGESWERGPYYLDGLVPLAFLTGDRALLDRVETWIAALLASQRPDGFFGPADNDDWWPRFVAMKAVSQYAETTGSQAAQRFLARFCDHMIEAIELRPPSFWAHARGLEPFSAILSVARRTGDEKYLALLSTLVRLTFGWTAFFRSFPYPKPTTKYLNRTLFLAVRPFFALAGAAAKRRNRPAVKTADQIARANRKEGNVRYLTTHGVNLAMAVKYPMYETVLAGQPAAAPALAALDVLLKHHGTAAGVFSSDEHLNGTSPAQGIELCTIVELMHSLEETLLFTGDGEVADRLERLAFNTLPAAFTSDLCAHQYLQQTNQPETTVRRRQFFDAGPRSTTFGVAPNFGCCAANLHQGFPKFAATAMLADPRGATLFLYAAGSYVVRFGSGKARIRVDTRYPFGDGAILTVESCSATGRTLSVRRPFGAAMTVNGAAVPGTGPVALLTPRMKAGDAFALAFAFPLETLHNADGSVSVRRGPLLFAERFEASEIRLGGREPFHDRAFRPAHRPRHALLLDGGSVVTTAFREGSGFDDYHANDRGPVVAAFDLVTRERVDLHLVPYGTATLRITHFATLNYADHRIK